MNFKIPDFILKKDIFKKDLLPKLKEHSLFLGWIAGLVLLGALVWTFSRPLLASCLMYAVNQSQPKQTLRLLSPLPRLPSKRAPLGICFSLRGSPNTFFVFVSMQDGIMIPCGAEITQDGRVAGIIPIGHHARQVFGMLPPGTISMYTRRIEEATSGGGRK
jgi:hypothetical protein